jgi:hypothetical protein
MLRALCFELWRGSSTQLNWKRDVSLFSRNGSSDGPFNVLGPLWISNSVFCQQIYSSLNSEHYTLNTQHSIPNDRQWTLHTEHWTLNTQHSALKIQHFTTATLHSAKKSECNTAKFDPFTQTPKPQTQTLPQTLNPDNQWWQGAARLQGYLAHKKQRSPTTLQQDSIPRTLWKPWGGGRFVWARHTCTTQGFGRTTSIIRDTQPPRSTIDPLSIRLL